MKITLQKFMMLVLVLLCTSVAFSQTKKEKNADKEFDAYEYIDARKVYMEIAENGKPSAHIYRNIAETHYWNSEYIEAVKWYLMLLDKDKEFHADADAIDYFRASQALRSRNAPGDLVRADEFYDMYVQKGGQPKPPTQLAEYVVELQKLSVINTTFSDFGPTYYGEKLVYASAAKEGEGVRLHQWNEQPYLDLYVADLDENGMPQNSSPLDGKINTSFHESSAVFTKDGQTVYFTRNNFTDGKKGKDKQKTIRLKLYKATKSGDNFWTNVVDLEELNDDEWSVAHPTLSLDEKYLYFSSDRPAVKGEKSGKEMSDLWMVEILGDNQFSEPKNLGPRINTENRESFPFISQENNLYFSSDGRGGSGGYDVFMVPLGADGMPSETIKNLGEPINSPQDDFGFIVNEEERLGYLSSNRESPMDGSKGDEIYLHRERCDITITGTATNVKTGAPLAGATVDLIDDSGKTVHTVTSGTDGTYIFEGFAVCSADYRLRVTKGDCTTDENSFTTPNKTETIVKDVALICEPPCQDCDLVCLFDIDRIHFAFDKYDIRDEITWVRQDKKGNYRQTSNADELAILLGVLNAYPNLVIAIESHTDSRGSHAYNEWLSKQRAISTKNWLVNKGIAPERLCAQAFGETELVMPCPDGVECTEEEHDRNRRSEYKVISGLDGCDGSQQRRPCITDRVTKPWRRR